MRHRLASGELQDVEVFAGSIGIGGRSLQYEIVHDVTERRRAEEALRASERRFRAMFHGSAFPIGIVGLDGCYVETNGALAELLGCSPREIAGAHLSAFLEEVGVDHVIAEFEQLAAGDIDRYEADRRYVTRRGERIWCHVAVSLVRDESGRPDFAITMIEDVTARKAAEDELSRRAMHDALTGLPNRQLLADRLGVALSRLERGGAGITVMFCDLDGFKRVNDDLGHDAGDRVLVEVAGRFRACLRSSDTLARYGGDEFVVLCEGAPGQTDAVAMAGRLVASLEPPIALPDGVTVRVGVSIGMTSATDGSRTGDRLIRDADTTMYRAKQLGGGAVAVFDPGRPVLLDTSA
jgi:diguanylate cyclase (GGDEF)-like protein/PAS domain S-box-containing protein